jgi:hypothetical protein
MIEDAVQLDACVRRVRDALDASGWRGGLVVALPAACAEDAALIAQELSLSVIDLAAAPAGLQPADLLRSVAHRPCAGPGFVVDGLAGLDGVATPAARKALIDAVLALETPHAVVVPATFADGELPKGVRRAVKVELPQVAPSPGLFDISLI